MTPVWLPPAGGRSSRSRSSLLLSSAFCLGTSFLLSCSFPPFLRSCSFSFFSRPSVLRPMTPRSAKMRETEERKNCASGRLATWQMAGPARHEGRHVLKRWHVSIGAKPYERISARVEKPTLLSGNTKQSSARISQECPRMSALTAPLICHLVFSRSVLTGRTDQEAVPACFSLPREFLKICFVLHHSFLFELQQQCCPVLPPSISSSSCRAAHGAAFTGIDTSTLAVVPLYEANVLLLPQASLTLQSPIGVRP